MSEHEKGIAEYYAAKDEEARRLSDLLKRYLDDVPARYRDQEHVQRLRERLERARYVGD